MFRHIEGCNAQYGDMTLMIAHNFAEWHVIIVRTPTIVIQGDRQFSEEKARAHARQMRLSLPPSNRRIGEMINKHRVFCETQAN